MPIPGLEDVSDDRLFQSLNLCLVGWALLACPPAWRPKRYEGVILTLCALFAALYLATLVNAVTTGAVPDGAGFDTLDGVVRLFSSREVAFSGWVHYVCFDLLAGLFIVKDAERRGVSHWIVLPILPVTLFAGPVGLLAYLAATLILAAEEAPAPRCPFAGKVKSG